MRANRLAVGGLGVAVVAIVTWGGAALAGAAQRLDGAAKVELVEAIATTLEAEYIYEDKGRAIAAALRERAASGAYDEIDSHVELGDRISADLYEVSSDKHLRVWYDPDPAPPIRGGRPEHDPTYGFRTVSLLEGNIGYLDLRLFASSDEAQPKADAAFTFLSDVDALIIDLRRNRGGAPWMVAYLSGWLFAEPTHLVSTWFRGMEEPAERWSSRDLGVAPRPDLPVYVLAGPGTFSAAESFTFGLRINDRITIVGEPTGGGGHFGTTGELPGGFTMFVPIGRSYDPRTEIGWEATGVQPHVDIPVDDALERAHEMALGAALAGVGESPLAGAWAGSLSEGEESQRLTLRIAAGGEGLRGSLVLHAAQREITLDSLHAGDGTIHGIYARYDLEIELRHDSANDTLTGTYRREDETLQLRLERR